MRRCGYGHGREDRNARRRDNVRVGPPGLGGSGRLRDRRAAIRRRVDEAGNGVVRLRSGLGAVVPVSRIDVMAGRGCLRRWCRRIRAPRLTHRCRHGSPREQDNQQQAGGASIEADHGSSITCPLQRSHNVARLRRSAFPITDTELNVMAALAIIGLSSRPNHGYRMPAAMGTPATL